MIKSRMGKSGQKVFAIGLIFVLIGIICNEWILAAIFFPDGNISPGYRLIILFFDVTIILLGLILIKWSKSFKEEGIKEKILQLPQSSPGLLALSFGLVLTVILLFITEGVFYILNNYTRESPDRVRIGGYMHGFFEPHDELFGYSPKPNIQASSILEENGKELYNVTYSIDEYSRRITPLDSPGQREKFILFFGGSFPFGEGVNDNETLPFYVGKYASSFKPYNYGFCGYGPQQMLVRLQSSEREITKEIEQKDGIAIFVLLGGHVDRAIGSMYVVNKWGANMPYYDIDDNNELVKKGSFANGRPFLNLFYKLIGYSNIADYFRIDFPASIKDEHFSLTARIIEESRNAFKRKFNNADFFVLIYPQQGNVRGQTGNVDPLIAYLEKAGIKYFNYVNVEEITEGNKYWIESDMHPTPLTHEIVAMKLVKDLRLSNGN